MMKYFLVFCILHIVKPEGQQPPFDNRPIKFPGIPGANMAEDKIAQAYFRLFYLMDKIKTLDNFITPHCKYKLNKRSPFTNIPLFSDLEMSFFYFFFDFYFWFQYIKYCKKLKHQIRSI